jgi:hypothetical protein
MKMRIILSVAVLLAALHTLTLPTLPAPAAGFVKSYRAPAALNPWGQNFEITPSGPGYLLSAVSAVLTNQVGQGTQSFVRLNQAGEIDWALALTEGPMGVSSVKVHPTEPLLFAKIDGLATEEYWTVFGVFNGQDGKPVFEIGVPLIVDQTPADGYYFPEPSLNVEYLSDGRCSIVMQGDGGIVRVAVIDPTGQPQWQRAFAGANSAFSIAGRGLHSALIEDPGRGFWLIVTGSQKITTQPNPPPINFAVTLSILRLSSTGDLVWAKEIGGLQLAQVTPDFGGAVLGADGSLIISFTDLVIAVTPNPNPTDYDTYTLAIGSDGQFRWATRVKLAHLGPMAGSDSSTFYLAGVRYRSIAPLNDDGVILQCDSATGTSLAQVSVNLSTAEDLTIAGISQNGIFIKAQPYFVPTAPRLGVLDLNLQNSRWVHGVDPTVASTALVYNSQTDSLLFAERPGADSRVDAISLGSDLVPVANGVPIDPTTGCQFFTNTTVSLLNPDLTIEKLALTPSTLSVSVYKTSLPLKPTDRIHVQPISPSSANLCSTSDPNAPQLSFRFAPGAGAFTLSFASQTVWNYEILFTPALGQAFVPLATVAGDGQVIARTFQAVRGQNGFYTVRAVPQ